MQDMKPEDLASDDYQETTLTYYDGTSRKILYTDIETEFPDGCLIVFTGSKPYRS